MTDELKQILRAQQYPGVYHLSPPKEAEIHVVASKVIDSLTYALSGDAICFCNPRVESFVGSGGGLLVVHPQVSWQ